MLASQKVDALVDSIVDCFGESTDYESVARRQVEVEVINWLFDNQITIPDDNSEDSDYEDWDDEEDDEEDAWGDEDDDYVDEDFYD